MEKRIIYCLKCPFTDSVHYIGKSEQGVMRPLQHLNKSHSDKIIEWVDELKLLGHKPIVEILEYVPIEVDIFNREKYWISKHLEEGCFLLNKVSIKPITILPNLNKVLNEGDDFRSILAEVVKSKRKSVGLSQEDFALKSGVGIGSIRKIEQKTNDLQLNTIIQVLKMFGLTLDIVKEKGINKKY